MKDVVIVDGPPTCRYVGIYLTDSQWVRLQAWAANRGLDVNEWTEELVIAHLEGETDE